MISLAQRLALLYVAAVESEDTAMWRVQDALTSGDRAKLQIESDEFNRRSVIRSKIANLYYLLNDQRKVREARG